MAQPATHWDSLFKGALVFDGKNNPPQQVDVAVSNGRIAEIGPDLSADKASQVYDVAGQWLMPGLLDIHTHFDLEVELAPGLPEAVRHGTTTCVVANCSLGVAYGNQRKMDGDEEQDPIVDCFARVENIPKPVLRKVADAVTWNDSGEYLDHFDSLNLGPNIVPMIPHSMLRIEVMGLKDSVSRKPTQEELEKMGALVEKGMEEGYIGFSTDALPFHYLSIAPNERKQIPTQFAPHSELKYLTHIVRRWDRIWQATPPKDSRIGTLRTFLLSSGRLFGKPLKTTATAAIDLNNNRSIARMGYTLSKLLNSWLIKGIFRFQALSAPFRVWSDGVVTPLAEEVPELRRLNEKDLEDRQGRLEILNDPKYIKEFRKMWFMGKQGFNIERLKTKLRLSDCVLTRELSDMRIDLCPVKAWNGEWMQEVYDRLLRWQAGDSAAARDQEEAQAFGRFPKPIGDDCEFFLHCLREYDTDFRWVTTVANSDPKVVKDLLFNPLILPGFNDSGAHLTNMAFYDGNLRTIKFGQEDGLEKVAHAIHRLTAEPAEFLGLNAGTLEIGAQADICVIDPEALAAYDPDASIDYIFRDLFEHHQMVNRPQGVVTHTMIAGYLAWQNGEFTDVLGNVRMGRVLRHRDHPAEKAGVEQAETPALAA
ncbi:MAG: amidohydrolase family protein [Salinisphaeraceae bacterium]|nr:amidohydrolase family protein [Salinisphaeraceae bacterium]